MNEYEDMIFFSEEGEKMFNNLDDGIKNAVFDILLSCLLETKIKIQEKK